MYTVDYFIEKFKAIPDNKWTTRMFRDGRAYCAMGHCLSDDIIDKLTELGMNEDGVCNYKITPQERETSFKESYELAMLFRNIEKAEYASDIIYSINNGWHPNYPQPTPKARILAALHDIKQQQANINAAQSMLNSDITVHECDASKAEETNKS